jgi:iron-sulfur cluster insertion protein
MITLTESAIAKIAEVLEDEGPSSRLRMYVQGGGCAGFSYGFTIDDQTNDDDFEIPAGATTVLVDSMSAQYLTGSTVDYEESLMGASFKIKNPQAQSTCGCGASFSA